MAVSNDKPAYGINLSTINIEYGSAGRKFSIETSWNNIHIDEDIDQNAMAMKVTFLDATDIYNKIDFDGTELLNIKFSTLGDREVDAQFRIYQTDIHPDPEGGSAKGVTLYGVSEEHFLSAVTDINQSYREDISSFAQIVFDKLNKKYRYGKKTKKLIRHETTGRNVTIIPGMTPFESMDFLASRAYDSSYRSSAFKFFETFDGYHFANIERLIAENKKDAIEYLQIQDAKTQEPQWNHIEALNFEVAKDSMHKIKSGMYASEAHEIDLINQKVVTSSFLLGDNFDEYEHLDKDAMSLESKVFILNSLQNINTSYWLFRNIGTTEKETNFVDIIPRRMYYLSALEQVKMSAILPGNSNLSPGKIINLNMLEQTAKTDNKQQEGKITGNYFITSVAHIITREKYMCQVSGCKESYRSNVKNKFKNIVSQRKS
jgi:hypothetical protein|tara:strand:+ start:1186 stop:2478 length:1293 start_codon:yes stop_codon:yes gene_type:complete